MSDFLDENLCKELREKINSTDIFRKDEKYMKYFNLTCAVMDRLDSTVRYLNNHSEFPSDEEDFMTFLMFSCIVTDSIKLLTKRIKKDNDFTQTSDLDNAFFRNVCIHNNFILENGTYPTDDKFFEYFRSLTFAHPFETSRASFLKASEVQYSPHVMVSGLYNASHQIVDGVGVNVYSNIRSESIQIVFSFDLIKKYVISKYLAIKLIIDWVNRIIENKENEWKKI